MSISWTIVKFCPRIVLVFKPNTATGVTQAITTDVAPIPLLWVVPLALYLLTFIVAFVVATLATGVVGVLLTLVPALALMVLVVIPREERYLEARFPSEYLPYKRAVRRWL